MSYEQILNEGGVAGHMNHLYDNGDLTFGKMKEIFTAAAQGKLVGTEKTDGQNLMISFSVKDGRAKGVRNKGEIKLGGLNPEQLAAKFADRANPALKETFAEALKIFEKAIQGLDEKTQIELFGPDTNVYYNAEVMDPRAPNVIQYDTKTLVIHRAGHGEYDRATGSKTSTDVSEKAKKLEDVIISAQEKIKNEEYGLQVNAIKKLEGLNDKEALTKAVSDINNLMKASKLSDSSSINEFMLSRIQKIINDIFSGDKEIDAKIDPLIKMNIAKKILGIGGIKVTDINKGLPPEQKAFIKENILNEETVKNILKTAIAPLENVVSDFATEMLKNMKSAYILDNSKEVKRLQAEVQAAINAIKSSGSEEAITILKRQLEKLKGADRVTATAEGFVFDYDGVTYKFTGNFAPMNQLLGLFKYGRGKIPAMKKPEEEMQNEAALKQKADIAIVPGAFKPPHKGHLHMVKEYANMANRVIIMVSPLSRKLPDGREVTFEISKNIWEMYLQAVGLKDRVEVKLSPAATPIEASYIFIGNENNNPEYAQPGQKIILGSSTKGGDHKRFEKNIQKYVRQGVEAISVPVESFEDLSATDMRKAISEKKISNLVTFLPDEISNKKSAAKQIIEMFQEKQVKENIFNDIIEKIIVETITKRGDKYCLISKKTKRNLGCYNTKSGAEKREKQVQYFKRLKEMTTAASIVGFPVKKNTQEEK